MTSSNPSTMSAVVITRHGGVQCLETRNVPIPEPGPGEALVKVKACGVNRLDILIREGQVPVSVPLPHICGSEITGVVVSLGEDRSPIDYVTPDIGARVAVAPYLCCGQCENCLRGEETTCLHGDIVGLGSQGGFAEYVVVPTASLVPLPDAVSFEQGASVTLSALTAYHMVVTKAMVHPGETVLVLAAGSGIGSAAISLCKRLGARVITTVGTEEKRALAFQLGADEVIHHRTEPIAATVRKLTGKRGVDVVVEHVGQSTWRESVASLARNGRLVTCGAFTGSVGGIDLWSLFAKQLRLIGAYGGTRAELAAVLQLVERGELVPQIHGTFPLFAVDQAQTFMEKNHHFGKLVVCPDN